MSLLSASPLLSSLFLTYANRAAALDGPAAPSPIDVEWTEMKTLNNRLQEEVASLRDQLNKEVDRAKVAEDCVEALRAQLSSVKCANRDLETEVSDERAKLDAITSEYLTYKKETKNIIAELRNTVDKEAVSCPNSSGRDLLTPQQGARAALSQVIAEQQISLARLKEQNESPCPPPSAVKESPIRNSQKRGPPNWGSSSVILMGQSSVNKQQADLKQPVDANQRDSALCPADERGDRCAKQNAVPWQEDKPREIGNSRTGDRY